MAGQNYANHRQRATGWLVAAALAGISFGILAVEFFEAPSWHSGALALLAAAMVVGVALTRRYALRVQDRVIRLEMSIRLAGLGLADRVSSLSLPQLIALRFASDRELPALLTRAASERMTPDEIKKAVTEWQADTLRT